MSREERTVLVDASVAITLADVGRLDLLAPLDGIVPTTVADEVVDDPAASNLQDALDDGWLAVAEQSPDAVTERARTHLGRDDSGDVTGDVALLAHAQIADDPVVVSDDRPLRQSCTALSIPVAGSIGVLVRAVEREDLGGEDAKAALYAMDEVGARLSASLVKRAETLIDDAAD